MTESKREEAKDYVMKMAKEHDVKFIRLWFTDILGVLKSFAITVEELEGAEARITARIVTLDRQSGILNLETQKGPARFGPVEFSERQWARLGVGVEVTIVRDERGNHKLVLPERGPEPEPELEPVRTPVATIQGRGVVAQVGTYHMTVDAEDGRQYGLMRSRVPHPTLREGDQIAFRAIAETLEIVEASLLERKAPGFGGWNPCDVLQADLTDHTGRKAIAELVRHFCDEERLLWHWITPKQDARQAEGFGQLEPDVVDAIQLFRYGHNAGDDKIQVGGISMVRDAYGLDTEYLCPADQLRWNQDPIAENRMGVQINHDFVLSSASLHNFK